MRLDSRSDSPDGWILVSSLCETQGQSFKNAWKSFNVGDGVGVRAYLCRRLGPRSSLYIHYIMMFIVVPTGTIVSKVNI